MCIVLFVAPEREVSKSHNKTHKKRTHCFLCIFCASWSKRTCFGASNEPNVAFYVLDSCRFGTNNSELPVKIKLSAASFDCKLLYLYKTSAQFIPLYGH